MQAPFKKKTLALEYQYCSLVNFCEIKVCPKTLAYFTLKLGWFKAAARTNMGPQNDTYLPAPEFGRQSFYEKRCILFQIHVNPTIKASI